MSQFKDKIPAAEGKIEFLYDPSSGGIASQISGSGFMALYQVAISMDGRRLLSTVGDRKIRADALDALLQDGKFLEKVDLAYLQSTKWPPYPERIFECAIQAVLSGTASGIAVARKKGKEDWAEIDAQYKSELSYAVQLGRS